MIVYDSNSTRYSRYSNKKTTSVYIKDGIIIPLPLGLLIAKRMDEY